jgi:hypothetical protein
MNIKSYRELVVWQKGIDLVTNCYYLRLEVTIHLPLDGGGRVGVKCLNTPDFLNLAE